MRRKRAREKIRTCTGAPDFFYQINGTKKETKKGKRKGNNTRQKQIDKGESKNSKSDSSTNAEASMLGVREAIERQLHSTWRAHVKTNRYTGIASGRDRERARVSNMSTNRKREKKFGRLAILETYRHSR